jgi:hypothetical protein
LKTNITLLETTDQTAAPVTPDLLRYDPSVLKELELENGAVANVISKLIHQVDHDAARAKKRKGIEEGNRIKGALDSSKALTSTKLVGSGRNILGQDVCDHAINRNQLIEVKQREHNAKRAADKDKMEQKARAILALNIPVDKLSVDQLKCLLRVVPKVTGDSKQAGNKAGLLVQWKARKQRLFLPETPVEPISISISISISKEALQQGRDLESRSVSKAIENVSQISQ